MDALPPQPPAYEQSIKQKLGECGLAVAGVSISYQGDLQGYEIVIRPEAGASPNQFSCIEAASSDEFVTFTDKEMQQQYLIQYTEKYRPIMIDLAKQELAKRGKLVGLPSRSAFESDKLFFEAIEEHCGLSKGSAILPFGSKFAFQPPEDPSPDFSAFHEKYGCLIAAIQLIDAEGKLEIGFVGNEAPAAAK